MLVTSTELLAKARAGRYAIPAFDCTEDVMIRPILDACEEMRSPVILMALEHDLKGRGIDYITSIIKGVAPRYDIPIVLHLDHAMEYWLIEQAIDYGFTSVMYDGSMLPFAQNVANTRRVVALAKEYGIATEAGLGHVAGNQLTGNCDGERLLTKAEEVAQFVAETGVDALAVSIGTAHGSCVGVPELNITRLSEINAVSTVPLVLHGGSGTPDDQVQEAIQHGITKLNIYANLRVVMSYGVKKAARQLSRVDPLPDQLFEPVKAFLKQEVIEKINLCLSANRV